MKDVCPGGPYSPAAVTSARHARNTITAAAIAMTPRSIHGVPSRLFAHERPTLEALFLHLTGRKLRE